MDEEATCQAIAEEQASELAHSHVWFCELEPDHEGSHRATFEWEGDANWSNVAANPTPVEVSAE